MSSDEKIMEEGGEGPSHETPQAITITIMDPSALETTTLDSALVASVEAQSSSSRQADGTLLMVPREGSASISVAGGAKDLLQTVTETHMGTEELPVISNINSSEDTSEQSTIQLVTKTSQGESIKLGEVEEIEELGEYSSRCCLICNEEMQEEHIPVFKSQTTTSHRKVSVFLGGLVGQKLTSRKAHSDIICQKCFALLNKLDLLEVEIRDTKDEIVSKYQESVAVHGGRARRKKPAAARKSDYVFPKIEPEDEDEQAIAMEMDETFEPHVEDLMEEEHDRREDRDSEDEEWEPEFKKTRIKREGPDADGIGPPKRKRGRPRKDAASKPKTLGDEDHVAEMNDTRQELSGEKRHGRPPAVKFRSCAYCDEVVPVLQLMDHLEKHEQQYSCPYCSHSLPRILLCKHIQEHHDDCIDECEICKIKYVDSSKFDRHFDTHVTGKHTCRTCGFKFETTVELLNHNHLKHNKIDEKDICQACGKCYTHRSKFISHVIKHHRGKVEIDGLIWNDRGYLGCSICQKKFKKASNYISHEKIHRNKRFYCPHCPSNYSVFPLLQDHILTHEFGDYECNECSVKFTSVKQLNLHKENVHSIEPSKVCDYCNKEFKENVHLICHRRKAHPESIEAQKAKYTCVECGMKFLVRGNLVRHLKMHENEKRAKLHKCDICEKVLSSKYSLATHVKSHSRGTNKCASCDKLFVSKYTLLDHVRRIHDEIGYGRNKVCKQCGRSFFKNSELEYHMKTHTGERPYRCDVCGETYLTTSTLKYHMQKHSNTVYVCQLCQSKFKNYVGWSAHVKRIHGVTCVREYTKEHGILRAVVEKDAPSLYILAPEHNRSLDGMHNLVSKDIPVISDSLNSTSLAVGLEETVVSLPGKEAHDNIVHVVSYDDLANPLVHTVDASEVAAVPDENPPQTRVPQSNENFTAEVMKTQLGEAGDANYSQSSDRGRVVISEGWELILSGGNEESQVVVGEEWESAHMVVAETREEQHMVLSNEWDGTQAMTQLVVKEGPETHVVMSSWKDCVDYE